METLMTQLKTPSPPQEIPIQNVLPVEEDEPQTTQQYYYQVPVPLQDKQQELIDRNIMIMIFVAFIAGLLLGKIMNPVILRQ